MEIWSIPIQLSAFLQYFVLAVISLSFIQCRYIIISQSTSSIDRLSCGTSKVPCKTLQYTIATVAKPNDTILLDGGSSTKTFTYIIPNTTLIDKALHFKSLSSEVPIIASTKSPVEGSLLFKITSNEISFTSIHFKTFFSLLQTVGVLSRDLKVQFTNCDFQYFFTLLQTQNHDKVTLIIVSCSFTDFYSAIDISAEVSATISQCNFTGLTTHYPYLQQIAISLRSNILTLNIDNTRFVDLSRSVASKEYTTGQIQITKSLFQNNYLRNQQAFVFIDSYDSNVYVWGSVDVFIEDCQFYGNLAIKGGALSINSPSKLYLTRTNFTNNFAAYEGGAININSLQAIIKNCSFINNTVKPSIYGNPIPESRKGNLPSTKYGGAIMNFGNLSILDCNFSGNTAPSFGGSIYHTVVGTGNLPLFILNTKIIGSTNNLSYVGSLFYANALISLANVTFVVQSAMNYGSVFYYYDVVGSTDRVRAREYPMSYTLLCPPNHKLSSDKVHNKYNLYYSLVYYCSICEKGSYSLDYEYEKFNSRSQRSAVKNSITCFPCPAGAICNRGIVSNDNFYGSLYNNNQLIKFMPCPPSYCCSLYGNTCFSYNTCNYNRGGVLCGECAPGYSENLISTDCISNERCGTALFWFLLLFGAFCYLLVIIYLKDITIFIRTFFKGSSSDNNPQRELLIPQRVMDINDTDENEIRTIPIRINVQKIGNVDRDCLVSGVFKIMVFFYQVEFLLHINSASKKHFKIFSIWRDIISSIFNFKPSLQKNTLSVVLCPFPDISPIMKEVLKISLVVFIFIIWMLLFSVCYVLSKKYKDDDEENDKVIEVIDLYVKKYEKVPFQLKLKCAFLQMLLFCYLPVSTFMFRMMNCVSINGTKVLFRDGEVQCFQRWQYAIAFIIAIWILPFCFALYWSIDLLKNCQIRPKEFLNGLAFPPLLLWHLFKSRLNHKSCFLSLKEAKDSQHLLGVFNEPFHDKYSKWEGMLVLRRVILVMLYVFIINPVVRLYIMLFFIFLFLMHHFCIQPYKTSFLNWLETTSLMLLSVFAAINLFWAEGYMYDVIPQSQILGEVFIAAEIIVLSIPILLLFLFILYLFVRRICTALWKCVSK